VSCRSAEEDKAKTKYILNISGFSFISFYSAFSPLHVVQSGSGAHPASYAMGYRGLFPGAKEAGA
jgi:hypothetical protein